jgi:cyclophilin family peptidyl-prolyl cis-trans isomerase
VAPLAEGIARARARLGVDALAGEREIREAESRLRRDLWDEFRAHPKRWRDVLQKMDNLDRSAALLLGMLGIVQPDKPNPGEPVPSAHSPLPPAGPPRPKVDWRAIGRRTWERFRGAWARLSLIARAAASRVRRAARQFVAAAWRGLGWIRSQPRIMALAASIVVSLVGVAYCVSLPEVAVLETTKGRIVILLHPERAPLTVARFEANIRAGVYDGTYFHRVDTLTYIQGGDSLTRDTDRANDGLGGWEVPIAPEVSLPNVPGAVAAISGHGRSNGTQFLIELADEPTLRGSGYTVFGTILEGCDVAKRISLLTSPDGVPSQDGLFNPGAQAQVRGAHLERRWRVDSRAKEGRPCCTFDSQ